MTITALWQQREAPASDPGKKSVLKAVSYPNLRSGNASIGVGKESIQPADGKG